LGSAGRQQQEQGLPKIKQTHVNGLLKGLRLREEVVVVEEAASDELLNRSLLRPRHRLLIAAKKTRQA